MSQRVARLGLSIMLTVAFLAGSAAPTLAQVRTVHGAITQIIPGPPIRLVVHTDTALLTVTLADASVIERRGESGAAVAIPVAQLKVGDEVILSISENDEVLSILVLTSQPPAAVVQTQPIEQPTLASGDTWTLRFLPLGKDVRFTNHVACDKERGCALVLEGSAQVVQAVPDIVNLAPDFKSNTYFSVFDWPLVQGKTWKHAGKATGFTFIQGGNDNTSGSWQTVFTVAAFERVRVLAGAFDAVRIEGKQCNEIQENVCRDLIVWYAPRAKYFVKIEYSGSTNWPSPSRGGRLELVSYQVH